MGKKYIKRIEKLEKAFNIIVDRITTSPLNELARSEAAIKLHETISETETSKEIKEIKKELCELKKVTESIERRYIIPNYIPANREG